MATPQTLRGTTLEALHNDYDGFIEKFKPKKTTDDCYTPDYIYEVVVQYVETQYGISRDKMVRPFWPGGDFENYEYKEGDVVVDNPPFSIMARILTFYMDKKIPFFLFATGLNTFSAADDGCTCICTGYGITYENGARVSTSFITNMEPGIRCRTAPDLYASLARQSAKHKEETTRTLPKYAYPDNVVTAAMLNKFSRYGVDLRIPCSDSMRIAALDSQKKHKKTIYGRGYLLSEKTAAEKAAAEKAAAEKAGAIVWQLSDRELEIIKGLGKE